MSRRRTIDPSGRARMTMSLNSCGVCSRPIVVIGSVSCVPGGDGSAPSAPGGIRRVLLAHRGRDVAHRQAELRHLVRDRAGAASRSRAPGTASRRRRPARASARRRRTASCSSRDTSRRSAGRSTAARRPPRMSVFALRIVMPFVPHRVRAAAARRASRRSARRRPRGPGCARRRTSRQCSTTRRSSWSTSSRAFPEDSESCSSIGAATACAASSDDGAREIRRDAHRRRRDLRIARDRQQPNREQAEQRDDDRDHGAEDRAPDEEVARSPRSSRTARAARRRTRATRRRWHRTRPGATFCIPSTTTRSPGGQSLVDDPERAAPRTGLRRRAPRPCRRGRRRRRTGVPCPAAPRAAERRARSRARTPRAARARTGRAAGADRHSRTWRGTPACRSPSRATARRSRVGPTRGSSDPSGRCTRTARLLPGRISAPARGSRSHVASCCDDGWNVT